MSPQSKSLTEKLLLIVVSALVSALVSLASTAYAGARQSGVDKERLDNVVTQSDTNTKDIKELQVTRGEVRGIRDELVGVRARIDAIYAAIVKQPQ